MLGDTERVGQGDVRKIKLMNVDIGNLLQSYDQWNCEWILWYVNVTAHQLVQVRYQHESGGLHVLEGES